MTEVAPGLIRRSIPILIDDMLEVHGADLVRTISQSPDLGRPGEVGENLPYAVQLFSVASKFRSAGPWGGISGPWTVGMVSSEHKDYEARVEKARTRLQRGLNEKEMGRLAEIVRVTRSGQMNERDVKANCAKVLAPILMTMDGGGEEVELPDDVAYASVDTLESPMNPFAYAAARRARRCVEDYALRLMPDTKYPIDYVHNLWAGATGLGKALGHMAGMTGGNTAAWMAALRNNPVLPIAVRAPLRKTTLGGLLPEDKPLVPGKSMVIFFIGEAFTATDDVRFMFGTGTEVRQCPFKNMFLSLMKDMDDGKQ